MGVFRRRFRPRRRQPFFYSKRAPISASAVDTWASAESLTRRAIYRKTAAETLSSAESLTRRAIYRKTAAEVLAAVEATSRRAIYRKTAADTLGLPETLTPRRILRASVTESLGLAGSTGRRADFKTTLADLLDLIESAAGGQRLPVSAVDAIDLLDATTPGYHIRRVAADTWQLAPVATRRAIYRPSPVDALKLTEAATYPVPADSGSIDIEPYEDSSQGSNNVINIGNNENACRAGDPWNALEFRDIDAPRYAIPTATYLNLYVVTNDDPGLTIQLQKTASPAALTTTASDISTRTPLTTGVAWNAANIGTGYKASPDFSADLAEVFALSDWTRGTSDLVVILHDNGTGGYLRYRTSEAASNQRPHLVIEWYIGGITISASAADTLELLEDVTRRAIVAAATSDAVDLTAAVTTALSLLVVDAVDLSEMVATLARVSVADHLILGSSVYLTYAMSLTEPLEFFEAVSRIATSRASVVDALKYVDAVKTGVRTSVGDSFKLTEALTARRLLAAIVSDALRLHLVVTGDIAGILDAIAEDRLDLSGLTSAGWHTRSTAADSLDYADSLAAVRHFVAAAYDAGAIGDIAAAMKRARATASDAAEFSEAMRVIMRTRAIDALGLSEAALATALVILHALAADVLELSEGTSTRWQVTARDSLEFVATVATIMHWIEEVSDSFSITGLAAYLVPSGIVRIEFAINGATVQFDVAMPRVDMELSQPRIDITGHGLSEQ